jgi:hypothetical protein
MGGPGSGLWYRFDSKSTVEEYRELPIHHFAPALRQVATGEREQARVPIAWYQHGQQVASILV